MAMLALTGVEPDENGLDPDPMTAGNADGIYFDPKSGRFELEIANGDASPHTATIETPFTGGVNALADNAIVIPAGERRLIRIKATELQYYLATNPDTGVTKSVIKITFDAVTSVTYQLRYFL